MNRPTTGPHVNHVVLTVRDIEASHHFYADLLGFERCGIYKGSNCPTRMWFYRGSPESHHDFALVQADDAGTIPPSTGWPGFFPAGVTGLNHIAIGYGSREEWLDRLRHLREQGVEFIVRGNHGMTRSAYIQDPDGHGIEVLYEVPSEMWAGDVDAALSWFEHVAPEDALRDDAEYERFG